LSAQEIQIKGPEQNSWFTKAQRGNATGWIHKKSVKNGLLLQYDVFKEHDGINAWRPVDAGIKKKII
jgi:hypothetical protein